MLDDPTLPTIPVFIDESIRFRPHVDPRSTVVLASQTPLDASRADLCRRPRRLVSSQFSFSPHQKPSRDNRCDVRNIVSDALDVDIRGWRCWMSILEREGVCFERASERTLSPSNNLSTYSPGKNNLSADKYFVLNLYGQQLLSSATMTPDSP